ncbi:hypothetical protein HMPREF1487_09447 [Pseudomonas sp. HPB0071]|uniref:Cupin domain-containing protein n=1 Tax=Pseudomonas luteola TaxID=47886 RepID=A0A2X2BYV1_PSELU|nr:hypothetical protein HMPREF1487_09447 [Pseudomonas sp. HPB0071]SPY99941.1 Uncharacterised protein [Pseudomonas luteola]
MPNFESDLRGGKDLSSERAHELTRPSSYERGFCLLKTSFFVIELNKVTAQKGETLHDHPWSAICLVVRGGYVERTLSPGLVLKEKQVRWFKYISATRFHAIIGAKPNTWVLTIRQTPKKGRGYISDIESDQASYQVAETHPKEQYETNKHVL